MQTLGRLDATLLDREQLDEVTEGDPEVMAELLDMLLASGVTNLARAARAAGEGNVEQARLAAHALKGAAATVGAARLAQACRRVEVLQPELLAQGLRETHGVLEETHAVLSALKRSHG